MSISISTLQKYKNEGKKITCVTAYDYPSAKFADTAGIDLILVGDSLSMVALGNKNTLSADMEIMLHHTKAVTRGVNNALVIADMPFMSYHLSEDEAVYNASLFLTKGNAKGIKLEGGTDRIVSLVQRLTNTGIPVQGHLGFTPQYLNTLGGFKVQGKTIKATKLILEQAKKLEAAGAFSIVSEMIPLESAKIITQALNIPTIGIGAGADCDGQVLVQDDLLGKYDDITPKFARRFADVAKISVEALKEYKKAVIEGTFPSMIESFHLEEKEQEALKNEFNSND
jgi:3-methyl-2-oxobutanoate hydroxymethyltransferase